MAIIEKGFASFFILVLFSSVLTSVVILYDTIITHSKNIDLIMLNIEAIDFIKSTINEFSLSLKSDKEFSNKLVSDNAREFSSNIVKTKGLYRGTCNLLKNGKVLFSKVFTFKALKDGANIKISDFKFV